MKNYSSKLISRIDQVTGIIDKKYDGLSQKTIEMIEDVGTYQLDEEKDGSYKKTKFEVPAKLLKK